MEKIEYLYKVYSKHFATVNFEYLSREEFINKIKTDDEFAKTWGISKIMENIHVLSKDKPSRLQKLINYEKIKFELCDKGDFFSKGVQIYITSDEEIKEGDWCLKFPFRDEVFRCIEVKKNEYVKRKELHTYPYDWCKKIILTTDQDLIKDGVQAIDDEFLEWFVQNPSCEFVEVVQESKQSIGINGFLYIERFYYKIIIPKEEPKQEKLLGKTISKKDADKDSFEDVTKYKKERMYSEEEVIAFGEFIFKHTLLAHSKGVKNLFEQFKNK